jgi:hypothetical protein
VSAAAAAAAAYSAQTGGAAASSAITRYDPSQPLMADPDAAVAAAEATFAAISQRQTVRHV